MIFQRPSSFGRSLKTIRDASRLDAIEKAVETLVLYLERHTPPPAGLGLKRLRQDIWEVRSSLRDRIVFLWRQGAVKFILAGNHDDIRRFLRSL